MNKSTILQLEYLDAYKNPQIVKVCENITEIIEHKAQGEGDKWYYDICYTNDEVMRIFNPQVVHFKKSSTDM